MSLTLDIWIALLLDFAFGDPRWLPHPVRFIGALALRLERPTRQYFTSPWIAGVVTAVSVISVSALTAGLCLWIAGSLASWLGHLVAITMLYTCFAAGIWTATDARFLRR